MNQSLAKKLKSDLFKTWRSIDKKISTKFGNLNGKTSKYNVPEKLFQNRTSRQNRVLISWKTILNNNITIEQLSNFKGGVCVEFVNFDFITNHYMNDERYIYLADVLGGDDMISSIITFRTEDGDSGGTNARKSYNKFKELIDTDRLDLTLVPIKRKSLSEIEKILGKKLSKIPGKGPNSFWSGNYYMSIKGGEQNSFESHSKLDNQLLFNPAIDYANEQTCLDLDITMSYFCLHCYDLINYISKEKIDILKNSCEVYLKTRNYDEGNLIHYCKNHPSLKLGNGDLIDAIQLNKISIEDFKTSKEETSSVICHNEAANKDKFYFDSVNNFLVTPARPTNLFWSTHLSNMMQQNFNLNEYYEKENERVEKRKLLQ